MNPSEIQKGIELRLRARAQRGELRQGQVDVVGGKLNKVMEHRAELRTRKLAAIEGMHRKRKSRYSAGEQFDKSIHQMLNGEPIINNDGTFRKKTNWRSMFGAGA